MKYRVSTCFCWYDPEELGSNRYIVKMYFIEGYPYTFDDIPEISIWDPTLQLEANKYKTFTPNDLYMASSYLIAEEAHPCLFPIEVDHPELIPEQ